MENKDITELNDFLKGLYMGIHTYDHYINECDDPNAKKVLQNIQQEHKLSAILLAERIQNLGGHPTSDSGIKGAMVDFMSTFTTPTKTADIISKAVTMEQKYAVHKAGSVIKGDISERNKAIIDQILERNENHVHMLQQLE